MSDKTLCGVYAAIFCRRQTKPLQVAARLLEAATGDRPRNTIELVAIATDVLGLPPEALLNMTANELVAQLQQAAAGPESKGELLSNSSPSVTPELVVSVGPSGFLGGEALADALGVHPSRRDAFFKRLERERINLGDNNWQEVADRRANSPLYQYRLDSPRLRELANGYKSPKTD